MANQYWLKREGKTYGPYSGGKLKKLAREGKIGPDDLISTDKRSWQLAETVRGLSLRATVKPPQATATASAPSPLEVSPRVEIAAGSHHGRISAPELEPWFLPRLSHSVRIAIGIAGIVVAGLIVTSPIWLRTLSEDPETSGQMARSSENTHDEGRSSGNPGGTRTPPRDATVVIRPDDAEAYYNMGVAYEERGRHLNALAAFKKAIAIKPDYAYAYNNMGFVYCNLGRYADAVIACKKSIAIKPGYSRAHSIMGIAYSNLGQHADALAACKKAIATKPDSPDAYYSMGVAYKNFGQHADALAAYKKAIALKPDYAEAYANMGIVCGNLKQYAAALAAFKKAVAIKPDYAEAYYSMGCAFGNSKQYVDALAAFKKVVAIKSDHTEAYANMGFTHETLKQYTEALAAYKKAIALKPTGKMASLIREAIRRLSAKEKETPEARPGADWSEVQDKGQEAEFKAFVADVDNILMVNNRAMYSGADRYLIRKMKAHIPAVGGDVEAKCRALKVQLADTSNKVDRWWDACLKSFADAGAKATWLRLTPVIKADLTKITKMRDELKAIIPR